MTEKALIELADRWDNYEWQRPCRPDDEKGYARGYEAAMRRAAAELRNVPGNPEKAPLWTDEQISEELMELQTRRPAVAEQASEAREHYIEAAMVACPQCRARVGNPCVERYCKNGYRNCDYAVCARWRDLDVPHLERSVRARQQSALPGDPS